MYSKVLQYRRSKKNAFTSHYARISSENEIHNNDNIGRLPAGLVTDFGRTLWDVAAVETCKYSVSAGGGDGGDSGGGDDETATTTTTTIADGRRTGNESLKYPRARTPSGFEQTHMSTGEEPPPAPPQCGHAERPKHDIFSYCHDVDSFLFFVNFVFAIFRFIMSGPEKHWAVFSGKLKIR